MCVDRHTHTHTYTHPDISAGAAGRRGGFALWASAPLSLPAQPCPGQGPAWRRLLLHHISMLRLPASPAPAPAGTMSKEPIRHLLGRSEPLQELQSAGKTPSAACVGFAGEGRVGRRPLVFQQDYYLRQVMECPWLLAMPLGGRPIKPCMVEAGSLPSTNHSSSSSLPL